MLASLLEARRIFAVASARLGVLRATEDERRELSGLVAEMERAAGDIARLQALDFDFIHALARASRNWVFVLVMNSVRPIYEEQRELFLPLYQRPEAILAACREVISALPTRDAARAARAIDAVMAESEENVAALLNERG
jgi:DNA-binding FadR family transcriptional regulator